MKKLFLGPYVGEFGWELFFWTGYCRRLSQLSDGWDEIIAVTRPGREMLYEDFVTKVIHYSPPEGGLADCENYSLWNQDDFVNFAQEITGPNDVWFRPFPTDRGAWFHRSAPVYIPQLDTTGNGSAGFLTPAYLDRNRSVSKDEKIVLLHARNRFDIRPEDNPPIQMFENLAKALIADGYKVLTIGSNSDSYVDGTEDFRENPLPETAKLMDKAICTVGTTSGPLHLATLMGCPVVTWQWDFDKMWYRFSSGWNPLDSDVVFIKTEGERGLFHSHPSPEQLKWAVEEIQKPNIEKIQVKCW